MTKLNATAKAALKEAGISQAAWARANYMRDGKWAGDICGCPDTGRCANGYHHFGEDDCGCLPALIKSYLEWLRGGKGHFFDEAAPEYVNRVIVEDNHQPQPEPLAALREAFAAIIREHPGEVVAVRGTEVIGVSAASFGDLAGELREKGLRADVVFRVPEQAGASRTYTHPDVFTTGVADGWAERETDPTRIDWPARQARAAIPFEVRDGRPVNPCETTGIRHGRNEMGFWGENLMADALVTVTWHGARYLLMVERDDGYGWAVPGGHPEPGETPMAAAVRELAEETGLAVPRLLAVRRPARYVPDPRSSDEAWAVTVPVRVDLGTRWALPALAAGDDARRAAWMPAGSYASLATALGSEHGGTVFAAHAAMLADFLGSPEAAIWGTS